MIPIEYLQTDCSFVYWDIGQNFNSNDVTVEFAIMPLTGTAGGGGWYSYFWGGNTDDYSNTTFILRTRNIGDTDFCFAFGDNHYYGDYRGVQNLLSYNTKNVCTLDKSGITVNGVFTQNTSASMVTPSGTIRINKDAAQESGSRCQAARYYYFRVMSGATVLIDIIPALDDNNMPCWYDNINHTYIYHRGNGNVVAGAPLHIFTATPSLVKFESTGGTLSFTVSAETGWTCTTPIAFTLSTTAGTSGDTIVTVTAANYTGATRIDEDITLTDDDGYTANVHLRQKPVSTGVQSNIYLGDTNIEVLKLGDKAVESIFLGYVQVYSQGAFQGIKMTKTASLNKDSGSTTTIKVKSSEAWTLSIDTAVTWLSASVMTGDTGETVVTLEALEDNTASTRSTVVSATSANFSATCVVTQYYAHYVGYIYAQPMGSSNQYIETGIYPTTATTMRIKFIGKGFATSGKLLGFSYASEEPVWKDATDNTDYRFGTYPQYQKVFFDYNSQRIQLDNQQYFADGNESDLTFGNYYVYDNKLGTNIMTGTTQTTQATTTIPIMVDVTPVWLQSLEIWQGETKVFDGKAAIDDATGHIGLFDDVTGQLVYNPDLNMGYGEVQKVDYICTNPLASGNLYIDTGIYPTTGTTMRMKFKSKLTNATNYAKMLGFAQGAEEDKYKGATETTDYRFFLYGSDTVDFDYNASRISVSVSGINNDGKDNDFTIGNNYIYDNIADTMIATAATQTTQGTTTVPIMVNVSVLWLKSLEIWQGNTKVFDGSAATMGNIIGLYDSVSDSMKWNPNLTMQAITN